MNRVTITFRVNLFRFLCGFLFLAMACNLPGRLAGTATAAPTTSAGTATPAPGTTGTNATPAPPIKQPAAPDVPGLKIVYTKDETLWLWEQGATRLLTSAGKAFNSRLSPDGRVVAFLRPADEFHLELWAINIDGSQERRLVSIADLDQIGSAVRDTNAVAINPYHYEWVPGTHDLAFNTHQVYNGPGLVLLNDLNQVDTDTMKLSVLLPSGSGGEFVYSPDGTQIALSKPDSIRVVSADNPQSVSTDNRPAFSYAPVTTYSEYRYYAQPVWSPDGKFLRVAIPPADPLARPPQATDLWNIPADGSPPFQEGSLVTIPALGEESVFYAPDLVRLAYLQEVGDPATNQRELWLATYDGNGGWAYAKAAMLRYLAWSTNGRRFVYSIGPDQQGWIGSLDASPVLLGKNALGLMSASWVDDQRLIYVLQRVGTFEIYLGSLDGEPTLLDTLTGAPPVFDFVVR